MTGTSKNNQAKWILERIQPLSRSKRQWAVGELYKDLIVLGVHNGDDIAVDRTHWWRRVRRRVWNTSRVKPKTKITYAIKLISYSNIVYQLIIVDGILCAYCNSLLSTFQRPRSRNTIWVVQYIESSRNIKINFLSIIYRISYELLI